MWLRWIIIAGAMAGVSLAWAEKGGAAAAAQRSVSEWLLRMHEASRHRAYIGTLVVSAGDHMASSRVWHVCDGSKQIERVESLSGPPRSTFRRNDEVVTFSPQSRVVVTEKREAIGLFPYLLKSNDKSIERHYGATVLGSERVAGFDADIVQVAPRDDLRFGYRIWSEKNTGLVLKLQTIDPKGAVLEQVAFSELQLDAPVSMDKLSQMMAKTEGYRRESPELVQTDPASEGWSMRSLVPGFRAMSCYRRNPESGGGAMQWVFTDGLASVSLFVEAFDPKLHGQEGLLVMGATHTMMRRWTSPGASWWLTVVGEVPAQTLQAFAQGLERRP